MTPIERGMNSLEKAQQCAAEIQVMLNLQVASEKRFRRWMALLWFIAGLMGGISSTLLLMRHLNLI